MTKDRKIRILIVDNLDGSSSKLGDFLASSKHVYLTAQDATLLGPEIIDNPPSPFTQADIGPKSERKRLTKGQKALIKKQRGW